MKKIFTIAMAVMISMSFFITSANAVENAAAGPINIKDIGPCSCPWSDAFESLVNPSTLSGYIGALVTGRDNQPLGRVVDVAVNQDKRVNFLIVAPCGDCVTGMQNRLVPVPYRAIDAKMRFDQTNGIKVEGVNVDLSLQDFQNAPYVALGQWPPPVGSNWASKAYDYYNNLGASTYARSGSATAPGAVVAVPQTPTTPQASSTACNASDLIGAKVVDIRGRDIGTIRDFAVDPQDNQIAFALLDYSGAPGKYIPVPIAALAIPLNSQGKPTLILDIDRDQLAMAPSIDINSYPDRTRLEQSYRYFGQRPYWTTPSAQ